VKKQYKNGRWEEKSRIIPNLVAGVIGVVDLCSQFTRSNKGTNNKTPFCNCRLLVIIPVVGSFATWYKIWKTSKSDIQ